MSIKIPPSAMRPLLPIKINVISPIKDWFLQNNVRKFEGFLKNIYLSFCYLGNSLLGNSLENLYLRPSYPRIKLGKLGDT
jgi:hypothetical protein